MNSFEIPTIIFAIFLFHIAPTHGTDAGCVELICPSGSSYICSIETERVYSIVPVYRNSHCYDQDESHENHDWGHNRGGNSHESGSNYGSSTGFFYNVSYDTTMRKLTVQVWERCQITLLIFQGTPAMPTPKSESTKGNFPPMIPFHGNLPSMTSCNKSTPNGQAVITSTTRRPTTSLLTTKPQQITAKGTTRAETTIPTIKLVPVSTRNTKLPQGAIGTTKGSQAVATTTQRPQVTTRTTRRTQTTPANQNMHTETLKYSRTPSMPTSKEQDVIKTTTKHQDIPSEYTRPNTTPFPQAYPAGEHSGVEHVKKELRYHENQQYGLMIGVPVGLVGITALILTITCLCRRRTKKEKNTSELSKGLSIVNEEKGSSAMPPSYYNPVYGELTKGKIICKSQTTQDKAKRGKSLEYSAENSHESGRIYEEIQSMKLNVHGTMSSSTSGLKSSKDTRVCSEPTQSENVSKMQLSWYPGMKVTEYKYMS